MSFLLRLAHGGRVDFGELGEHVEVGDLLLHWQCGLLRRNHCPVLRGRRTLRWPFICSPTGQFLWIVSRGSYWLRRHPRIAQPWIVIVRIIIRPRTYSIIFFKFPFVELVKPLF